MSANIQFQGTDLDLLFAVKGASAKRADVGFQVSGSDISNRYKATIGGDLIGYNIGYRNSSGQDMATLFQALSFAPQTAPVITAQPVGGTFNLGDALTVGVTATGNPTPVYQWYKNGSAIGGATGATYVFQAAVSDNTYYFVVVSNANGSVASNNATFVIQYSPVLTAQPTNYHILQGNLAIFNVAANGVPTPNYQWRKDGANIGGATSDTYSIFGVQPVDAGNYSCVVYNTQGQVTSATGVLVVYIMPVFTTQPTGGTISVTNVLNLVVAVSGDPAPTLQWSKNGVDIGGATGTSLTFQTTSPSDSGNYRCRATNPAGSVNSAIAAVTVNDIAPTVTGGTVYGNPTYNFSVGNVANFTVEASGTNLTYQWKKNGSNIGYTSPQGPQFVCQLSDAGTYSVHISNSAGSVDPQAVLNVS